MYQPTPAKFIPLPNSEMNIAKKKYRNPRCAQMSEQSVFGGAVAVIVEDMGRTNHFSGSRNCVVNVLAGLNRISQVKFHSVLFFALQIEKAPGEVRGPFHLLTGLKFESQCELHHARIGQKPCVVSKRISKRVNRAVNTQRIKSRCV